MSGRGLIIVLIFVSAAGRLMAAPGLSVAEILALYKKADGYFNSTAPSPTTDSLALSLFDKIIREAGTDTATRTVLINSYVNKGILLDVKGSYAQALAAYTGALRRLKGDDSLTFQIGRAHV